MKREIKFRAWDKEHKRMLSIETLALRFSPKGLLTSIYTYGPDFSNDPDIICGDEPDLDSVILEQFTGLHDKNGREIYEGDIVSFEDSDGGYEYRDVVINTGIVEYGELGFYFTNRVAVEMDDFYIKDGRCDGIEVIGNIHENPELLEEKK